MFEVDMHTHSHYSDGSESPTQLIMKAKRAGLKAVCLTDHDTTQGLEEFADALKTHKMDGLPSLEVCSIHNGAVVHILGYEVAPSQHSVLEEALRSNNEALDAKIARALDLYRNAGIMDISLKEMNRAAGCMGKTGFVLWLREYRMLFGELSRQQAKDETEKGGLAYADYDNSKFISPHEAVGLLNQTGEVPIWAHPGQFVYKAGLPPFIRLLPQLVKRGLKGLEVVHPTHSRMQTELFKQLCMEYGLLQTGGSDFHGRHKPQNSLGQAGISYEDFLRIKALL
jgi:3',5'-nucleoside bisphosphate phosphatase